MQMAGVITVKPTLPEQAPTGRPCASTVRRNPSGCVMSWGQSIAEHQ
jgi:hypothetical protein